MFLLVLATMNTIRESSGLSQYVVIIHWIVTYLYRDLDDSNNALIDFIGLQVKSLFAKLGSSC